MSGLGYALGGALMGAGKGMAEVGMQEMEQRRQTALENLRSQNRRDEQQSQYDLMDRNNARQIERSTNADITKAGVDAGIQKSRDERQHGFAKDLRQIDFNNDVKLKQVASSLGLSEDAVKRQRDAGEINRIVEDGAGQYTIIYNDSTSRPTGVSAPVKDTGAGGGSALDRARGGGAATSAAPAPAPSPAKPKAATATQTYTAQQLNEFAQAKGISTADARKALAQMGYRLAQ